MLDANGRKVGLGDKVLVAGDMEGVVVCSIDTGEGSRSHPIEQWAYLRQGVMVETPEAGLIHISESGHIIVVD